jgi:hypothetical protein
LAIAAAVGVGMGCASTGYNKAGTTVTALDNSAKAIVRGNMLIDETLVKLNDLVYNPSSNLLVQFKSFEKSVNELGATVNDVGAKSNDMKAQGAAYFADWDQKMAKMKNEDIRHRSEARNKEVSARFDRISKHYDEVNAAFAPYMSDLHDVQSALSVDLTSGGLSSVKDAVGKAKDHAAPLKKTIEKLSSEFEEIGLSMSAEMSRQ